MPAFGWMSLANAAAYFLIPGLNAMGRFVLSRFLLMIVASLLIVASALGLGKPAGIHIFLLPMGWASLVLFEWEERKSIAFGIAFNSLLLLAFGPEHGLMMAPSAATVRLIHFCVLTTILFSQILVVLYFLHANRRTEAALSKAGEAAKAADKAKTDPQQPAGQRVQVHGKGPGNLEGTGGDGSARRIRRPRDGKPVPPFRGGGYRHRHCDGFPGPDFPILLPGRRIPDAASRRQRAGPVHIETNRGDDGRRHRLLKPPGRGQPFPFRDPLPHRRLGNRARSPGGPWTGLGAASEAAHRRRSSAQPESAVGIPRPVRLPRGRRRGRTRSAAGLRGPAIRYDLHGLPHARHGRLRVHAIPARPAGPGQAAHHHLTADAMPGTRERCLESGMDDVLTKPILSQELNRMLSRWLGVAMRAPPSEAAPPQSPKASQPSEWVDVEHLREMDEWIRTYDPEFWDRAVDQFRDSAQRLIADILAAGSAGRFREAGEAAHTLKGLCLMMGLSRMSDVCKGLETAGIGTEGSDWRGKVSSLETFIEPSLSEMRKQVSYRNR